MATSREPRMEMSESIYANSEMIRDNSSDGSHGVYEDVYANKNNCGAKTSEEPEKPGSKFYKVMTLCLGILSVLLLAALTGLCLKFTADRDLLQTKYTHLTAERDQLQKEKNGLKKKVSYCECFRIGDWVRVKASVHPPKHLWAPTSNSSVGVVTAIKDEKMLVDFPEHKSWITVPSKMELAPKDCFRVGDRVKVKASVKTPKYKWGRNSNKGVGVVTAIDGERMTVDYPEHKSWKAAVSEMELAPSADSEFCKFKPGDRVRVKASVKTPKYNWGSVSHKSVGTIKALKLVVDFPEKSDWAGDPAEMELSA